MDNNLPPIDLNDLYEIEALVEAFPKVLSVPQLRWQLRHRHENGLACACIKTGRNILISKSRYERWLGTKTEDLIAA